MKKKKIESDKKLLLGRLQNLLAQANINQKNIDQNTVKSEIEKVLTSSFFKRFLIFADLIVAIVDNTTLEYPYMSESVQSILGYPPSYFYTEGVHGTFKLIVQKDIERMLSLTQKFYSLLISHPPEERLSFRITYDLEACDASGTSKRFLQEMIPLANDKQGTPYLHLLILSDITGLKTGTSMNWKISRFQNGTYQVLEKGILGDQNGSNLTTRELEIVQLLAEGISSVKIANKLGLSEETVKKHRKNILRKSNSKNAAELVRKAVANGWL